MVAVVSVWFTVVHCGSLWFSYIEDNGGRGRARERSWDHLGTNNRDQLGPADQSGRYLKSVIKLPDTSQDCFVWENWKIILSGSVLDLLLTLHQVHSQYRAGQDRSRPGWKYKGC